MKTGNVTGNVYERSIHKKLNSDIKKNGKGAAHGEDCAFFSFHQNENGTAAALAQTQTAYTGENCAKYAVCAAVNQAAAAGVRQPAGVIIRILLPASAAEQTLQHLVEEAQRMAEWLGTVLADVKASVTAAVNCPVVTAAAVGSVLGLPDAENGEGTQSGGFSGKIFQEGSQIVMTKWAGLEGSAVLAECCRKRLRERYPSGLIDEAAGFERYLSVLEEAAAAVKSGAGMLCAVAEGGVFRALWTLAQRAGTGLEIDIKKIPIRQETVEICNFLDINPYELAGNGSLLCVTNQGEALAGALQGQGIPAAVIGTLTKGNDRVIRNGEERRYLEPAKEDEIYKILNQGFETKKEGLERI